MDAKIFRNRLFGALCDEFPGASVAHFPPMHFMVGQEFDGQKLSLPLRVSPLEALAKKPDVIIEAYVKTAREQWDKALSNRQPPPSVIIPTSDNANT